LGTVESNVPKACNGNASLRTLLLLLHKFARFCIAAVAIIYVVFPPLIYAVPSGGASHIQFPVIGIGDYIHALLSDSVFFQLALSFSQIALSWA